MPQLKPKLKPLPCPFCGRKPKVLPTNPKIEGDAWAAVACFSTKCFACPVVGDGDNLAANYGSGFYKDLAISRWNKRSKLDED